MWPSLLLYGGLFVAFGFAAGLVIWAALVVRRAWHRRGAEPLSPAPRPRGEAPLHTVQLGGEDVAESAWAPEYEVDGTAARRREPGANPKLLNFPRS